MTLTTEQIAFCLVSLTRHTLGLWVFLLAGSFVSRMWLSRSALAVPGIGLCQGITQLSEFMICSGWWKRLLCFARVRGRWGWDQMEECLGVNGRQRMGCHLEEWEHALLVQVLSYSSVYGRPLCNFRSGLIKLSCILSVFDEMADTLWKTTTNKQTNKKPESSNGKSVSCEIMFAFLFCIHPVSLPCYSCPWFKQSLFAFILI